MSAILETQEITETRNGKTSIHRVGPQVVKCALLILFATLAFIFSIIAMSGKSWVNGEYGVDVGLFNVYGEYFAGCKYQYTKRTAQPEL